MITIETRTDSQEAVIHSVQFSKIAAVQMDQLSDIPKPLQELYSLMKYGSPTAITQWANMLMVKMLAQPEIAQEIKENRPIVLTSSAYGTVPTAANVVMKELAGLLKGAGVAVETIKLHREGDFSLTHYGTMSLAERIMRMAQRTITISSRSKAKIAGRMVVVVDDLRATGSHEQTIHNLIAKTKAKSCCFVYMVSFSPLLADLKPETEEDLNKAIIKTVPDLLSFFAELEKKETLNARTLKFILSTDHVGNDDKASQLKQLGEFLEQLPDRVLLKLYNAAISKDAYCHHYRFVDGFHMLANLVVARRLVDISEFQTVKNTTVLFNLSLDADENLIDIHTGENMNRVGEYYSMMKFSSAPHVTWFAEMSANRFIERLQDKGDALAQLFIQAKANDEHIVMVSPGSRNIESAQKYVFDLALQRINIWLALNDFPTIIMVKLPRFGSGTANYSELTMENRMREKSRSKSSGSVMPGEDFFRRGVHVIFADDTRITGVSADRLETYCMEHGALSFTAFYCVMMDPKVALYQPAVEHYLNHFKLVDSLNEDVLGILNHPEFRPVQRMVRLLLHENKRQELPAFLERVSGRSLAVIYQQCLGNNFLHDLRYRDSLLLVREELRKRNLIESSGMPALSSKLTLEG